MFFVAGLVVVVAPTVAFLTMSCKTLSAQYLRKETSDVVGAAAETEASTTVAQSEGFHRIVWLVAWRLSLPASLPVVVLPTTNPTLS